ncbi:hypothetical protein 1 [Hubei sobemo-like virus 29]|uniref:hypothetical protein 1 n=1 Tax=Hubei sobemo-like virus 29 TaxID=1923215 RepID=UPI0009094E1C|nr:hypothetical protein 1 [Hubei sobemo-like virus 29]APG75770.1 hypothetical protein 1 [Hubei sobemo-like virus 29]
MGNRVAVRRLEDEETGSTGSGASPVYAATTSPDPNAWVNGVIWWCSKALLALLMVVTTAIVVYRWMAYAVRSATRKLRSHMEEIYSLLDYISPSETEAEREEKVENVYVRVRSAIEDLPIPSLLLTPSSDWVFLAFGVVTLLVGCYVSMRSFGRVSRNLVHRIRGIQYESVREGSSFRSAKVPAYQIAVMEAGLLSDTHIGYGCRYCDYLVLPRHVLEKDGALVTTVLLKGPLSKVMTNISPVQSRVIDDLVYCYLEPKTWSCLGAAKGKWANKLMSLHVTCTGIQGQTAGRLARTAIRWMMSYTGTTIEGMSGAAYESQGEIHGIHQGATGPFNLGISSLLVTQEMALLCQVESSLDTNKDAKVPLFYNQANAKLWSQIEAMDELLERYSSDSWALGGEVDYSKKLDFGEEAARRRPVSKSHLNVTLPEGGIRLANQNNTGSTTDYVVVTSAEKEFLMELGRSAILERIEALETKVAALGKAEIPCPHCETTCRTRERMDHHIASAHPKVYRCQFCEVSCRTEKKLQNHLENNHVVKKESAIPADTGKSGKVVKTGSFLGKRQGSQRNNTVSSARSSSLSSRAPPSPCLEESLSGLMASQRSIESSLKKLLEVMAGRNSAMQQS